MNAYEAVISKHADLSALVATIASENRAATADETKQLDALKTDIETIRKDFESAGRKAFLDNIDQARKDKPVLLTKDMPFAEAIKGAYNPELERVSLSAMLDGYINSNWDAHPLEAKAQTSSPTSAGGILIPAPLSARVIDMARAASVVQRAGAITVPMGAATLKMARQTADPGVGWYSPNSAISETDGVFDSVTFTARKLACLVRVENELLADSSPGVDGILENSIAQAIARELDRVGIYGTGVPPQPLGIYPAGAGINAVASIGSLTDYDKFVDAIALIRDANYEPNAAVYGPAVAQRLSKLKSGISGDKTPLVPPADWTNLAKYVSNQAQVERSPDLGLEVFIGQWDQLAIGMRMNLQIEVSRSGGQTNDVFALDQSLIRAVLRADVQVLHATAFTKMTGIS